MTILYDFIKISSRPAAGEIFTVDTTGNGRLLEAEINMETSDTYVAKDRTLTYNGNSYTITEVQRQSVRIEWDANGDGIPTYETNTYFWYVGLSDGAGGTLHYLLPDSGANYKNYTNTRSFEFFGNASGNYSHVSNFTTDKTISLEQSPVCFLRGTKISTKNGMKPVEELRPGDEVWTLDNGLQKIRWVGGRKITKNQIRHNPKLRPVRIRENALGEGFPGRDLIVSRQHRLLVRSRIAKRMFDTEEVLLPAIKLVGMNGVEIVESDASIEYWHILFDRHEVIWAEGALAESLYCGPEALKSVSSEAYCEILAIFPEILNPGFLAPYARHVPKKGKQINKLIDRHARNQRPLLEFF